MFKHLTHISLYLWYFYWKMQFFGKSFKTSILKLVWLSYTLGSHYHISSSLIPMIANILFHVSLIPLSFVQRKTFVQVPFSDFYPSLDNGMLSSRQYCDAWHSLWQPSLFRSFLGRVLRFIPVPPLAVKGVCLLIATRQNKVCLQLIALICRTAARRKLPSCSDTIPMDAWALELPQRLQIWQAMWASLVLFLYYNEGQRFREYFLSWICNKNVPVINEGQFCSLGRTM